MNKCLQRSDGHQILVKIIRDTAEKYFFIDLQSEAYCMTVMAYINMPLKSKYFKVGNVIIMKNCKNKFYN